MERPRDQELDRLLEDLSYQVTAARSAGLGRPEELRRVLKRMTTLLADIDAIAVTEMAASKDD